MLDKRKLSDRLKELGVPEHMIAELVEAGYSRWSHLLLTFAFVAVMMLFAIALVLLTTLPGGIAQMEACTKADGLAPIFLMMSAMMTGGALGIKVFVAFSDRLPKRLRFQAFNASFLNKRGGATTAWMIGKLLTEQGPFFGAEDLVNASDAMTRRLFMKALAVLVPAMALCYVWTRLTC